MKEAEATNGTKLHALLVSFLMRERFATSLARLEEQSGEAWDRLAEALARDLNEMASRSFVGLRWAPRVVEGGAKKTKHGRGV